MIGNAYFFRTCTYHIVGRVVGAINGLPNLLELEEASWVADSGRFMSTIKDGTLNEVEPLGKWFVNIDTVTDFGPWVHPLPNEQR